MRIINCKPLLLLTIFFSLLPSISWAGEIIANTSYLQITTSSTDAQGKTTGVIPGVASGSYSFSNTQGITHATIGEGEIEVGEGGGEGDPLSGLNRDITKLQEITKKEETTVSAALPIATPEQVKTGLAEIKTAGKTIGKQIDIAQTTAALEKEFGAETAAAGKDMLERWAAGDAHALDGCIGGGSAWNLFVSDAYANPIAIAAGGCSVILAAAVITAVNSGNQQLLPDSIRNNSPFLDNLGYTVNEKGEIIPKDASADTSFSCRFLGNCEMKIPSDGEETTRKPEGGSVAAAGGGGLEPDQEPEDWEPKQDRSINIDNKQLQAKFKHAEDFGIDGNYNLQNAERFKQAINNHIINSETQVIRGTYRGTEQVTHYFNPKTELNVIQDSSGNFRSAWKLTQDQINSLIRNGNVQ